METSQTSYGGARAEERPLSDSYTYLSNLGSYFHGLKSYLPSSIKKQLPVSANTNTPLEEKDIVLWASFDTVELNGARQQLLIVGYSNGFQVWNLQNPTNIHEVFSKREGPIKCVKFLPTPYALESPEHPLHGKRPLLAVASAGDGSSGFPKTMVKLYSLRNTDYVNVLKFRTEVYSILCSKRMLVVALKDHLHGFDAVTMEKVMTLDCYPCPSPQLQAVVSLGPRWLAYATSQPVPNAPVQSHTDKLVEVAKDVAKDIASGLYYLGQKTLNDYVYASGTSGSAEGGTTAARGGSNANNNNADHHHHHHNDTTDHHGTVMVYDVVSRKPIAHFQAHAQPLSAVAFDPSGVLLVTASIEGHNFNVFQITPYINGSVHTSYKHLYKLQRGLTNATIQHISFSDDSKWMAVSSTRGTTHIYAINPSGGSVNVLTHVRAPNQNRPRAMDPFYALDHQYNGLVTLPACNRIKQNVSDDKGQPAHVICASAFFAPEPFGSSEKIYLVNQLGVLTQYQLLPHPPPPSSSADLDPYTLQLTVEPVVEWDVCRRTKWPELTFLLKTETAMKQPSTVAAESVTPPVSGSGASSTSSSNANANSNNEWLSNVEICTHSPLLRPLWANPQFTFKTFQPVPNSRLAAPSATPSDVNIAAYLFYESTPTKKIEVRHPNNTSVTNNNNSNIRTSDAGSDRYSSVLPVIHHDTSYPPSSSSSSSSSSTQHPDIFKNSAGSSSTSSSATTTTVAEDLLKENLFKAMSTPMDQIPKVSVTSPQPSHHSVTTNTDDLHSLPPLGNSFILRDEYTAVVPTAPANELVSVPPLSDPVVSKAAASSGSDRPPLEDSYFMTKLSDSVADTTTSLQLPANLKPALAPPSPSPTNAVSSSQSKKKSKSKSKGKHNITSSNHNTRDASSDEFDI